EAQRTSGFELRAGVVEFPADGVDPDELVNEARTALEFARSSEVGVASRVLLQPLPS
ncbi:MAG: hypothetical protein JOZ39_07195, partial [Chloroflexi bacterium]|nr:hypothetical protein [Chloroflexota bacterium]